MPINEVVRAIAAIRKWERENPDEAPALRQCMTALAANLEQVQQYLDRTETHTGELIRKVRAVVE